MWKRCVSYLLILDKKSYIIIADKPFGDDITSQKLKDKWEEDNDITKDTLLSHMYDALISLFEECKTTKESLTAMMIKYGGKSSIHMQLLFEKFNTLTMGEDSQVWCVM